MLYNLFTEHLFLASLFSLGIILLFLAGPGGWIRYIPNNRIGILEKLFSLNGSVKSGIIALNGEAGFQPDVLRGGWHVLAPFIYRVHQAPLVTVPQGSLGYVFARDGEALSPQQTLGSNTTANNFEEVEHFLRNGGQKGPQRSILREGTYAINLAQFVVITREAILSHDLDKSGRQIFMEMAQLIVERDGFVPLVLKDRDDCIGVVTVHDGLPLGANDIIAPTVGNDPGETETFHNNFQDPETFLRAGGRRGRQYQVLVEGTYYINRLFATVEVIPKTVIEVGQVGVVVSYTGTHGGDLSGKEYKHGELVKVGERGVWDMPLLPGKYAFNTYAGRVMMVPTTNFILKWKKSESGSHGFDENLSEVSLITRDAFEPSLSLCVVVHIDYRKAPLVIQRFGDIKRLVEQTLDPMVSAYFKNVGQTRTLIQLLQDRSRIQDVAGAEMKEKFGHYNLELEEVLIGTPNSSPTGQIEQILNQLRMRQVAEEQIETYQQQQKASAKERELRETEAKAQQQRLLTESEISIQIQGNQGRAEYQRALQQAAQIRALADAEAEKAARIGIAQAMATEEQVRAYGGPQFQVLEHIAARFAEAIERSGVDIVPRVMIGDTGGNTDNKSGPLANGNLLQALLALVVSEKVGVSIATNDRDPKSEAIRSSLLAKLAKSPETEKHA